MANSIWGASRRLEAALFADGYKFDFLQVVRLLAQESERRRPGARASMGDETVRFSVVPSMGFPAGSVVEVEPGVDGKPPHLTLSFLGIIGPQGMLPDSYTEYAIRQKSLGDASFAAFFDIFHQRLLWLFYKAWEKHHLTVGFERASESSMIKDSLTQYLLDLIGMGTAGLRNRLPFSDDALLRYAGLLAQRPRSAECLRTLLADFFVTDVAVEQFQGRWHALNDDELSVLGEQSASCQLGKGAVAGDKIWSRQAVVRIVFGPLSCAHFFDFLPDGRAFKKAVELIRWYLGPVLDFELQPMLAAGEVPSWCSLGASPTEGPRLGWSSWLTEEPFAVPASQAVFAERERI
jgi:type VI secretion system protein ImpH